MRLTKTIAATIVIASALIAGGIALAGPAGAVLPPPPDPELVGRVCINWDVRIQYVTPTPTSTSTSGGTSGTDSSADATAGPSLLSGPDGGTAHVGVSQVCLVINPK